MNSDYVSFAKKELKEKNIRITSTSGFPLGANTTASKVFEARECALYGADELDVVMNVGRFLSGDINYVIEDLKAVVNEFKSHGEDKLVKVIIETSLIGPSNIEKAVECVVASGADFAKTTTGFGKHGARYEDVEAMIKAAKGVSKGATLKVYRDMISCDKTYGIGDSYNDLPLLTNVDVSFTFHSSPKEIQDVCTHIVDSIAEAIDIILSEEKSRG